MRAGLPGMPPPRAARQRRDGHCCEACALGLACGSHVDQTARAAAAARAAGYNWREAPDAYRETVVRFAQPLRAAGRAAGDPPSCQRRSGESVAAYRARCGLEESGIDGELWRTMDPAERRAWLREVATTARASAAEEARLVREGIQVGFQGLREILATIRTIRVEEIRSGAAVQIASIRGLSADELAFLDRWDQRTSDGRPPRERPAPSSTSPASPVATLGVAAVLAKLAGLW